MTTQFYDLSSYLLIDIIGPKVVLLNKTCYVKCKDLLPSYMAKKNRVDICIAIKKILISKKDNIELVKKIYPISCEICKATKHTHLCIYPYINNIIRLASGNGCIQILEYFLDSYGNFSIDNAIMVAIRQSQYMSIKIILEYAYKNKIKIEKSIIIKSVEQLLHNIYLTRFLESRTDIYYILEREVIKFQMIGLDIDINDIRSQKFCPKFMT